MVELLPGMHEVLGSIFRTTATNTSPSGCKFLLEIPMSTIFTHTALFCGLDTGNDGKKECPLSGSSQAKVCRLLK